jgi:hypothetical protein
MHNPLTAVLPFILAAARSLTLGIQSPSRPGRRPIVPAETEYQFLAIVALCLLGLLVFLFLVFRFPDFGAIIAEYNQF